MSAISTSKAQTVEVDLSNIDNVPLTATYADNSTPSAPVAINITSYAFSFQLQDLKGTVIKSYTIASASTTSTYLSKGGTSTSVLNMQLMWQDIQTVIAYGNDYSLLMIVTDGSGNTFVHIIYQIIARRY